MLIYIVNMRTIIYVLATFQKNKSEEVNQVTNPLMILGILARLAGLPPLIGFFPKWILVREIVSANMLIPATLLLTATSINFYIYLRIFIISLSIKQPGKRLEKTKTKSIALLVAVQNITPVIFMKIFCKSIKAYFDRVNLIKRTKKPH